MDDDNRKQVTDQLEALRSLVAARKGGDAQTDRPLLDDIETVRALVADQDADRAHAHKAATSLEQRLLAWEAEHPELVALATRVVRALEDAGL